MSSKKFTKEQFYAVNRLNDIYIHNVKRLIHGRTGKSVFPTEYRSEIMMTPNNLIVEFRFIYDDVTYLLLALVDLDGNLFLPDYSEAKFEFDYIFVID